MKVKFFQINIFKFDFKKNKDQKQPGRKYGQTKNQVRYTHVPHTGNIFPEQATRSYNDKI